MAITGSIAPEIGDLLNDRERFARDFGGRKQLGNQLAFRLVSLGEFLTEGGLRRAGQRPIKLGCYRRLPRELLLREFIGLRGERSVFGLDPRSDAVSTRDNSLLDLPRRWSVDLRLVAIVEKREDLIVLTLADRIIFVLMAPRATECQTEIDDSGCCHAIGDRIDAKLFLVRAAFLVDQCVAMKAGGDQLVQRRIRQHVAGELFDRELIERHPGVDGRDHPLAILPDFPTRSRV